MLMSFVEKRVGGPRQDSATREALGLSLVAATKKESFETHLSSVAFRRRAMASWHDRRG